MCVRAPRPFDGCTDTRRSVFDRILSRFSRIDVRGNISHRRPNCRRCQSQRRRTDRSTGRWSNGRTADERTDGNSGRHFHRNRETNSAAFVSTPPPCWRTGTIWLRLRVNQPQKIAEDEDASERRSVPSASGERGSACERNSCCAPSAREPTACVVRSTPRRWIPCQ